MPYPFRLRCWFYILRINEKWLRLTEKGLRCVKYIENELRWN
ncbi:unnamed protein product [Rhodiola kirilowii]